MQKHRLRFPELGKLTILSITHIYIRVNAREVKAKLRVRGFSRIVVVGVFRLRITFIVVVKEPFFDSRRFRSLVIKQLPHTVVFALVCVGQLEELLRVRRRFFALGQIRK